MPDTYPLFDSHLHIIDQRFPLIPNNGYLPPFFSCNDYFNRMQAYNLCGGAVVSGSFQGFDQSYITAALKTLGQSFVGVTQLKNDVSDAEIIRLNRCGVRAIRFNLKRGGSENVQSISSMASRVYEVAGWHAELYVDSSELPSLYHNLVKLPAVSIDHLGLSKSGFKTLLQLAEKGVRVKATGFGRVDFPVVSALNDLHSTNPESLMFGTDLPSTRAPRAYADNDFQLVADKMGSEGARKIFYENAVKFYRI